jgi:hypothetical protein
VAKILRISRLDQRLPIFATTVDALARHTAMISTAGEHPQLRTGPDAAARGLDGRAGTAN